jgi:hypothetical protein
MPVCMAFGDHWAVLQVTRTNLQYLPSLYMYWARGAAGFNAPAMEPPLFFCGSRRGHGRKDGKECCAQEYDWDAPPYRCGLNTKCIVVDLLHGKFSVHEFDSAQGAIGWTARKWAVWCRFTVMEGEVPKFVESGGINAAPLLRDPVREILAWTVEKVRPPTLGSLCFCLTPYAMRACLTWMACVPSNKIYVPSKSNGELL